MSESGGSEIEEVGAPSHYFPVSRQETEQDHSRLLSSSFSWDPHQSSNFTSTLDIEAIKVSHSAGPSELLSLSFYTIWIFLLYVSLSKLSSTYQHRISRLTFLFIFGSDKENNISSRVKKKKENGM